MTYPKIRDGSCLDLGWQTVLEGARVMLRTLYFTLKTFDPCRALIHGEHSRELRCIHQVCRLWSL
jgi:hypothetical protein